MKDIELINCTICGNEFFPKNRNAKYCSDKCRKIARREQIKQQQRKRRAKNPERVKEYYRQYYQKNAEKIRAYNRAYYPMHIQEQKAKIQACADAHNNCFACDTPDGECRFD